MVLKSQCMDNSLLKQKNYMESLKTSVVRQIPLQTKENKDFKKGF